MGLNEVFKEAGLQLDDPQRSETAVREMHGTIFFGDTSGFEGDPAIYRVALVDGYWDIAAKPSGWLEATNRSQLWVLYSIGLAIAFLSAALVFVILNRQLQLSSAVKARTSELSRVNQQLELDIIERRKIEEELRAAEAHNRALLTAVPDLLFELKRDGTFLASHAKEERDLIMPSRDFLGRRIKDVFPKEQAEAFMLAIQRALRSGEMQTYEYQLDIGNEIRDFEARTVASGRDEVLSVVRDITERKQVMNLMERRVAERTRELSALLNVSQKIASTIQLRPLLNIILDQLKSLIGYDLSAILLPNGKAFTFLAYRGEDPQDNLVGSAAPAMDA
jgi:PAS domain S-box-containing protein